jgi:LacI family transcriptional regulator, sucrose operon repressor
MVDMQVTIQDIAEKLSISNSTVSRVLNNRGMDFISEATRKRVLKAVDEMGYRPNRFARALATGRTHMVALVLPSMYEPYYAQVIRNLQGHLFGDGFSLSRGVRKTLIRTDGRWTA